MADLSELFAAQQTNVIQWDGGPIFGVYEFPAIPELVIVEFLSAKASPPQGIQLRMRGGRLRANDVEADNIVLWRDTAPSRVEIEISRSAKGSASLKLWNVWRGGADTTQAWLGNSAIRVEDHHDGGATVLHCSDGHGEPSFDDLVLRVIAT